MANNSKIRPPTILLIVSIFFALLALGITGSLFIDYFRNNTLPQQTVYWFIIALVAALVPWIKEFKWKGLEIKLYEIADKIEWLSNRRYANLIYLIDEEGNTALINHPTYKKWIPSGTRLEPYEMPDTAVHRALKEELGLRESNYEFWPKHSEEILGGVRIVPRPYQVQVELGVHRGGIPEHYDFVYICTIRGIRPKLNGKLESNWYSLHDLKEKKVPTFEDVLVTFEKILREMGKSITNNN